VKLRYYNSTAMIPCQVAQICAIVRVVTSKPIAEVLGDNCRRIRTGAGVTQDELAKAARRVGLKWTASKVRDFESGRSAPTFATVLALTAALDNVTKVKIEAASTPTGNEIAVSLNPAYHPVRLSDLIGVDGEVTVTEDFQVASAQVADYCSGGSWSTAAAPSVADPALELDRVWSEGAKIAADWTESVIDWPKVLGLTELRVAAALGITTEQLGAESLRLWDTMFSNERDRRAGPGANRQKRGHVTRQLKAELQKAITDGDD